MNLPALTTVNRLLLANGFMLLTLIMGIARGEAQTRSLPTADDKLENGTYLYGQVAQPNQIQKEYVVFQHHNGEVIGAFYYPRSEFHCFRGNLDSTDINVQPAVAENAALGSATVELENLHRISALSNLDRRILSVCRQEIASTSPSVSFGAISR